MYPDWRSAGLRYYSLNFFYRWKFGHRVWKVSVDAGLNCPNRDGTVARGGCTFCDPASFSPSRRLRMPSIRGQIVEGIRRLRQRYGVEHFLAYFQPATNTFAPLDRLRAMYEEAIAQPGIEGLIVGTRPDCVADPVLDLLAEFAQRTWFAVEFGLQSIHARSLQWMNRGHDAGAFFDAVARSRQRGLQIGTHVILGLPGEGDAEIQATAQAVAATAVDSVKLHNLYAVKNTVLAEQVAAGEVKLPELDDYVRWVVDFLELLPPHCVIDRLSGDAFADSLIGPAWCAEKTTVRTRIEEELARRDTWQGRKWEGAT